MPKKCAICDQRADREFKRVEVWSNERWRLTTSTYKAVKGFCYLEPKRHIEYITELDGTEADEFGRIMAVVTSAIKKAFDAKLVYIYIYGEHIPHLHVHLAPHKEGDIYQDDVVKNPESMSEQIMQQGEIDSIVSAISRKIIV